jgi:putative thioredoxin
VLEKAVEGYGGAVQLVKMNIDEHPEIAGQLGIRSIPAVVAFRQGQPMDGFVGAQTESQIRAFLERLVGPATGGGVEEILAEADAARAAGEYERAMALYGEALQHDQENAAAIAGLGLVSVDTGNADAAKELLESLTDEMRSQPPIQALEAAIRLKEQAASLGGTAQLKERVAADPADHQARFDLAVALAAEGDRAGAVDALVEIMRGDREWNDGAAQKELLSFFEAWGPADPATIAGRRKMASVLFA